MKKLLSLTLLFVFALSTTYAQDIAKEAKAAKKLVNAYALSKDAEKLDKAKEAVMMLFKNDAANSNFDALMAKGELNAALAGIDGEERLKATLPGGNPDYKSQHPGKSIEAVRAYIKAIDAAEKSSQTKAALSKLQTIHNEAGQEFSAEYNAGEYGNAFNASLAVLESYDILKANGKSSAVIADEEGHTAYRLYSGAAAYYGEDYASATPIMEGLVHDGSTDPTVYKILFDIYTIDKKEDKAIKALRKGRELDPESKELLFAEIDFLIKKKENTKVQTLLEEAIKRDPENPAIYQALAGVFSDLFKATIDSETDDDTAEGETYFQKSKEYAEKAFELDNSYYDAQIILAELHYNKAVVVAQQIDALPYDSSKEGQQKYDGLVAKMKGYFAEAVPYCKTAEKIDPNRKLALIFLQEILAKTGEEETSMKIKERVAQIDAGKKFDSSFFN